MVLPPAESFYDCVMFGFWERFRRYIDPKPSGGGVDGCWSFRKNSYSLLVVMDRGKNQIQGSFPPSFLLSYLVLGGKEGEGNEG